MAPYQIDESLPQLTLPTITLLGATNRHYIVIGEYSRYYLFFKQGTNLSWLLISPYSYTPHFNNLIPALRYRGPNTLNYNFSNQSSALNFIIIINYIYIYYIHLLFFLII